jgi:hypothetical protein
MASLEPLSLKGTSVDEVNGAPFDPEVFASAYELHSFVDLLSGDNDAEALSERLDVVISEVIAWVGVCAGAVELDEGVPLRKACAVVAEIVDSRPGGTW